MAATNGATGWEAYAEVYAALNVSGGKCIIVGGQACNIWGTLYLEREDRLAAFKPFTSEDLDIRADNTKTVRSVAAILNCGVKLSGIDNSADVSLGALLNDDTSEFPHVQFLKWSKGIATPKLIQTALHVTINGIPIRVTHPAYTLQGKLECLKDLSQHDRQDEKHAKMAICYTACFLQERVAADRPVSTLPVFEHLFEIARSSPGLHAWRKYGIAPENALPTEAIETSSGEKFIDFREKRLPQCGHISRLLANSPTLVASLTQSRRRQISCTIRQLQWLLW